jgi:hypothetical protein
MSMPRSNKQLLVDRLRPVPHLRTDDGIGRTHLIFGKHVVEIFTDVRRFPDDDPAMDQYRHNRLGIELEVFRGELLPGENVDVVTVPGQAFLSQVEPDFGGTDGRAVMIKFECVSHVRLLLG